MKMFVLIAVGFAVLVGILAPSQEADVPAATAASAEGGLFEAPAYKETQLSRRPNGHFYVTADVGGASVEFVVDTGATAVALTEEDARAIGLQFSSSEFEPVARTASGIARGKIVTLPKISIEGKEVMEVEAMIIEGADMSLLGQTYLSRISGVQMAGEYMILK